MENGQTVSDVDNSDEGDLGEDADGEEREVIDALEGQTRPGVNKDEEEDDDYCL